MPEQVTSVFTVRELDCPTEEQLLRRAIGPVRGVADLSLDVMARTVTVVHDPAQVGVEALAAKIRGVGMTPALRAPASSGGAAASPARVGGGQEAGLPAGARPDEHGPGAGYPTDTGRRREIIMLGAAGVCAAAAEGLALAGVDERSFWVIALALGAILLGGIPTLKKGLIAVRTFTLNINFLMTIAVVGAAFIGQWPEAAMVIVLFGAAELIESYSLDRARNAVRALMEMTPATALVRREGAGGAGEAEWVETPAAEVPTGSVVRVKPGERLPLDGVVEAGSSAVNQAPITGESVPVDKKVGDQVFAGTINESGVLEVRTSGGSDQTTLARIVRSVQEAQGQRAPTQRFVDRFARVYTPVVVVFAILVALVPWMLGRPFDVWLYRALVLLVIACPCALVISTPVTIVSGLTAAARRGILIKGGVYLEQGRGLRILAVDKTGTVTRGQPELTDVKRWGGAPQDRALQIAASLDALSDHPVARAVVRGWKGPLLPVEGFESITGRGVAGTIGGAPCFVGSHRLAHERGVCTPEVEAALAELEAAGKTALVVGEGSAVVGLLAVADTPRETSVEAVAELHRMKVRTVMLSGDNQRTAEAIARTVGIDDARGGLLPEDKLRDIGELLEREGANAVGMAGDGVNDAPALARASIGFAMGAAGSDTALETADVALMKDDLRGIPEFIALSRRTSSVLWQNIALALGLKVVFFVLALVGVATLWMAVIADVGASLLVVGNGLRLLSGGSRLSGRTPGG